MTKEQQEILEQDRKDTQEHIDSLSQEELEREIIFNKDEVQEMKDELDVLLKQYDSNKEIINEYKNSNNVNDIEYVINEIVKTNELLLKNIKSLDFDIAINSAEITLGEDLDDIPVEELQEMQDSLDILLEQYTSNLDEIEKYKDTLRENIKDLISVTEDRDSYPFDIDYIKPIKVLLKQLNKENKILLEEIESLEFDINYYTNN